MEATGYCIVWHRVFLFVCFWVCLGFFFYNFFYHEPKDAKPDSSRKKKKPSRRRLRVSHPTKEESAEMV